MFGYAEDSFFTLGIGGRIGLLALSLLLAAGCVVLIFWVSRRFGLAAGLLASVAVAYLFIWLSPQIYYGYYLLIFDGLPVQWVIKSPPALDDFMETLGFQGQSTLSAHGQGALFWGMCAAAVWRGLRRS